jgi:hypothetical protein
MRPTEPPVAPSPEAQDPVPPFVWRCAVCLHRRPFGLDELEKFARLGWPQCCGETVLGFLAACTPEPPDEPRGEPD